MKKRAEMLDARVCTMEIYEIAYLQPSYNGYNAKFYLLLTSSAEHAIRDSC